ncbi:hypothetical protein K7X08_037237 [Anisodus acutangulus]|uniref:Uncharacterized protein n=1 Tax=Anisodus acutangulus TaxID=402998 RepID=A0A9Q1L6R7_9SOLA|nr:hypothetical protein K7X08_037237 [Anisodus acutangulus]
MGVALISSRVTTLLEYVEGRITERELSASTAFTFSSMLQKFGLFVFKDHYDVLGVSRNANKSETKSCGIL